MTRIVNSETLRHGLPVVLSVVLVGAVIALTLQNRSLKEELTSLRMLLYEQVKPSELRPGDYVMELRYRTLDGRELSRSFLKNTQKADDSRSLFAFIAPDCGLCSAEVSLWNDLAADGRYAAELIGISVGGGPETEMFVAENNVQFPVYIAEGTLLKQLRLPGVPALVRVSATGRVENVIVGAAGADAVQALVEAE